jgi:hypothetical protein
MRQANEIFLLINWPNRFHFPGRVPSPLAGEGTVMERSLPAPIFITIFFSIWMGYHTVFKYSILQNII